MNKAKAKADDIVTVDDPLWYKDAVIYEIHVRAFRDSNGDGIGDFPGLVEKLDYLQDLGVTAIWLLPFYPSPLRDDGYDIADYAAINPSYGSMRDFKRFLKEAHARGLRVITELVINHTSSEHPWFQRARKAPPGSKYRDFYVWSDTPERYADARIIFQDFETSNWTWDPVAKAYYWHRFYSHQPDLNFENPAVQKAVFKTLDFWMDMGVDGMRLDAVPYLYEREGTNCENLPETHEFLKKLRRHIDQRYDKRMILAEANQWPEDAAAYFGDGDECHMNFHFPVMPRMFMAVQLESSFPILDILEQTPQIPDSCQWAVFLRNHDELTLEMVTDEDRDYMYRMYAHDPEARINLGIRRRLSPLLQVRRKAELLNGLLLSLPGTPVLYYGDEIGMGDNIYLGDRDGVRTPMQWSSDRNAGFSDANPQRLYLPVIIDPEHHFQSVNVEAQQHNPNSLLWWMKRIIALRKQYRVFGRGDIEFLTPDNPKVLAFVREYQDERVLAVFNLSRFAQFVELDLSDYEGVRPVELFGHTEFPRIGELPYLLTLGPHEFYWFFLEQPEETSAEARAKTWPVLEVSGSWEKLLAGKTKAAVSKALVQYVSERRWFRGKARRIRGIRVLDSVSVGSNALAAVLEVDYVDTNPESYLLPVDFARGEEGRQLQAEHPNAVIAEVRVRGRRAEQEAGVLYDPLIADGVAPALLAGFRRKAKDKGKGLTWSAMRGLRSLLRRSDVNLEPRVLKAEQSNSNVVYGDQLLLKLYRKIEPGENPDVELGIHLTREVGFQHTPEVMGTIEYSDGESKSTVALLQRYVPNQGDAWVLTLDELERALERALAGDLGQSSHSSQPLLQRANAKMPEQAWEFIGTYLSHARLLGTRTAQMHLALARKTEDPAFKPERFSTLHQRSLYQSGRSLLRQNFQLLSKGKKKLPEQVAPLAEDVLSHRQDFDGLLKRIVGPKIDTVKIRCHGDYHLGQVLHTGKDFVIIDFEGEPSRALSERRLKRSPLRDVAGMLRSFHYAATTALHSDRLRPEDADTLTPWAHMWTDWVSANFMAAYLAEMEQADLLPEGEKLQILLEFYLIEKCIYELGYELQNRPQWVSIPLIGLRDILQRTE